MTSLRNFKFQFFILLSFGLALIYAQTSNLNHDLEHKFHAQQETCAIYFSFNSHVDFEVPNLNFLGLHKESFVSPVYVSHHLVRNNNTFAIRAPPQYLQS